MHAKLYLKFDTTPGGSMANSPAKQKTQVWSLGQEDPVEKEMATYFSVLAWKIPWTAESGKLESMGPQMT